MKRELTIISEVFSECLDLCAPLVTWEVKMPFAPWITEELKALMQQKNKVLKDLRNDRNNINLKTAYRNLKKPGRGSIHRSKSEHFNKRLEYSKGNSKIMRKTVR